MSEIVQNIEKKTLFEYFHSEVKKAFFQGNQKASENLEYYLVNLLTEFSSPQNYHRSHCDTQGEEKPLAILLLDSICRERFNNRFKQLKNIGDYTLFSIGFFSNFLERRGMDINYYFSMGKSAYQGLTALNSKHKHDPAVFAELSHKFEFCVDTFNAISETSFQTNASHLLGHYEKYLRTQSPRLKNKLIKNGFSLEAFEASNMRTGTKKDECH